MRLELPNLSLALAGKARWHTRHTSVAGGAIGVSLSRCLEISSCSRHISAILVCKLALAARYRSPALLFHAPLVFPNHEAAAGFRPAYAPHEQAGSNDGEHQRACLSHS
jgi:hypothetical protein